MEEAGGDEKGCEARGWREQGPAEEEGHGARPWAASTLLLLLLCCRTWLFISVPPQQRDRGTASRALPCAIGSGAAGKPAVRAQQVLAEPRQPGAEHPSAAGCPMSPW